MISCYRTLDDLVLKITLLVIAFPEGENKRITNNRSKDEVLCTNCEICF